MCLLFCLMIISNFVNGFHATTFGVVLLFTIYPINM